jgi:hypothetical protein
VLCFFSNLSLVEHAADGLRIPGLATSDQPERFELGIVLPLTDSVKSARCWLSFTYFGESVYADITICQYVIFIPYHFSRARETPSRAFVTIEGHPRQDARDYDPEHTEGRERRTYVLGARVETSGRI